MIMIKNSIDIWLPLNGRISVIKKTPYLISVINKNNGDQIQMLITLKARNREIFFAVYKLQFLYIVLFHN